MRRLILILMILLTTYSAFSDPLTSTPVKYEYVPYEDGEFPKWSMELRRAESIFFGSFVIALPVSVGVYTLAKNFGLPSQNSTTEALYQVAGAASIATLIALTDWIIGKVTDD